MAGFGSVRDAATSGRAVRRPSLVSPEARTWSFLPAAAVLPSSLGTQVAPICGLAIDIWLAMCLLQISRLCFNAGVEQGAVSGRIHDGCASAAWEGSRRSLVRKSGKCAAVVGRSFEGCSFLRHLTGGHFGRYRHTWRKRLRPQLRAHQHIASHAGAARIRALRGWSVLFPPQLSAPRSLLSGPPRFPPACPALAPPPLLEHFHHAPRPIRWRACTRAANDQWFWHWDVQAGRSGEKGQGVRRSIR